MSGSEIDGMGCTEEGKTRFLPQGACISAIISLNIINHSPGKEVQFQKV